MGREGQDDDRELTYLTEDNEGNKRLRLSFWLYDQKLDKYFVHSFNLTDKERVSKAGDKTQYINSVCRTAWSDEEKNLPMFFTDFLDKEKESMGKKKVRKALVGEEELGILLRSWLGKMTWSDPESEVLLDNGLLFKEDYREIRSLIDSAYDTSFVILLGVKTDENDSEKHYQQVYGKGFLPRGFMNYITNGMKFPTDYTKKTWQSFESEVNGEYGFRSYFELVPITEYDSTKDVMASATAKADISPSSAKY